MKLFQIYTAELGIFYVVETDPTSAEKRLTDLLNRADYGFESKRRVVSIQILTNEITSFPGDKPFFSPEQNRLILPTSCPLDSNTPNG